MYFEASALASFGGVGWIAIEDIKRRQADVEDFLLTKKDFAAL